MKISQLTESTMPQTVAIIFGRFNPPHKGHKHAWETASQVADQWYVGTNQSTIGPDDPLPFEVKIEAMKAIMPDVAEHLVAEQSWWTLATYVFKKYGGVPGRTLPIDLVVITDEPYVVPGLLKSNGQVSAHGEYSFQNIRLPFESIEQAKKHLRISSATALRNAVANGDREGFAQAAGVPADTEVAGHKFFDLVAHYLMPHREAHAAKEKAKAEKLAAKQSKEQEKANKVATKAKGPAQELAERSVSQKQARFMAAAAHDAGFANRAGIKQSVAKEFNKADTGTKRLSQAMKQKPKKKLSEIAGAFPSPSTKAKWAADAAASNAAEAKRLAAKAAQAQQQRLAVNTPDVNRLNQVNYSGVNAPKPSNATWDGDSSFLDLDGTQYSIASRMPISGDVPPDMKLIVTKEGRQVYIWTRNSLKGVHGRYFYPAANPATINEFAKSPGFDKDDDGKQPGSWKEFFAQLMPELKKMGFDTSKDPSHNKGEDGTVLFKVIKAPLDWRAIMIRLYDQDPNQAYWKVVDGTGGETKLLDHGLADLNTQGVAFCLVQIEKALGGEESVAEGSSGGGVRKWANQVRKDHGTDIKFVNRKEGGGAVDIVRAINSQGETVGVYNRKTGYPTVYEPQQGVAEGAPIVVMPRADRLKKPEPTKVRYQGDIVPPTKPPSTEKRGVKGRPGQRPMPEQGVAEAEINRPGMKDSRPYSDPYRRHPGNSSYMTPEYLIQKYKERLAQIASGPYKRPKEVAQLQSRIAKLEKQGIAEVAMRMQGSSQSEKDANARAKALEAEEKAKHLAIVQAYVKIMAAGQPLPPKMQQSYNTMPEFKKEVDAALAKIPGRPGEIDLLQRQNHHLIPKNESKSDAIANTAKRLTDPADGKTAKLRAAGDKRREEHLKTRDVAKKHDSHKRLSEALNDIYESRHGSIQADVAGALPATFVIPKLQNQDAYHQYRFGLAVAAARGEKGRKQEQGEQFAGTSPWGENEIVVTFDPSEIETIDAALKLVGLNSGDKRALNNKDSIETSDVSKSSPVANIKRNKYGI